MPGLKSKTKIYIFLFLILIGLAFLFFNEFGILKYQKLNSQVKSLKEEINSTTEENKMLEGDIDSLQKKVPAKIEKTAREKYHMIRKGEKVIHVQENNE